MGPDGVRGEGGREFSFRFRGGETGEGRASSPDHSSFIFRFSLTNAAADGWKNFLAPPALEKLVNATLGSSPPRGAAAADAKPEAL